MNISTALTKKMEYILWRCNMTNRLTNGRGKKMVTGKVAAAKKGKAAAAKRVGERTNALKKVARSAKV